MHVKSTLKMVVNLNVHLLCCVGEFGIVYRAQLFSMEPGTDSDVVAVKMLKG